MSHRRDIRSSRGDLRRYHLGPRVFRLESGRVLALGVESGSESLDPPPQFGDFWQGLTAADYELRLRQATVARR